MYQTGSSLAILDASASPCHLPLRLAGSRLAPDKHSIVAWASGSEQVAVYQLPAVCLRYVIRAPPSMARAVQAGGGIAKPNDAQWSATGACLAVRWMFNLSARLLQIILTCKF